MIITMSHIRQCRMCSHGAREFFERHGLNWGDFLKQGIPSEKLEATKDTMALHVIRIARGQQ